MLSDWKIRSLWWSSYCTPSFYRTNNFMPQNGQDLSWRMKTVTTTMANKIHKYFMFYCTRPLTADRINFSKIYIFHTFILRWSREISLNIHDGHLSDLLWVPQLSILISIQVYVGLQQICGSNEAIHLLCFINALKFFVN